MALLIRRVTCLGCATSNKFGRTLYTIRPASTCKNVETDLLIIGSGGAAMTAALRAKHHGLSPLIVEKASRIGGTTGYSGGGLWIPNSGLHPGVQDSIEEALKYMEALIGDAGPASTRERKLAFLENGPKMIGFLAGEGFRWVPTTGYPDYYPNLPGGMAGGRSIEGDRFDLNKLGSWKGKLSSNPRMATMPLHTFEAKTLFRALSSLEGMLMALKIFGWRRLSSKLLGRAIVTMGGTLAGQLLHINLEKNTPIWTDSPMKRLTVENGKVTGATVEHDGALVHVKAKKGVILAAGGFARNAKMRQKYQEAPITADWTVVPPNNDMGDAITAAIDIGAATALMDDSWWGPVIVNPMTGQSNWTQYERALPYSIIVDKGGRRFTNEAQSYTTFCHDMYERNRTTPAIPAYMIVDARFRKRYILAGISPGKLSEETLESGFVTQADTLESLAKKLDIDAAGLLDTVKHFNTMAVAGVDEDYERGGSAYNRFFGDPAVKPNPNLGTIEKGPFSAVKIHPGDLGTKGGVLTDEWARALRDDGGVIEGLYAVGNSSASVMGREYAGAGSTLGPAMTFAYVAVEDMVRKK
ncbi:3-ketosteroid dehydrogenase [Eremomyces bilateralis CBS 781.70]|uniref:3-ketosteroid dehydrogenase n=1 Tax=Eremomyces bilateralis CBS 781.70 TaxID=1392243 RepID=A0A6G1FZV7_9PEZI|nr:3-ketosteroid dehydrogenase [Eremomyces bilateralis CBS 781.70]KAF1811262.1 3-ketosteroid dehydrogenase [Eremomyces bilateralis CBS 781.70]